MTKINLRKGENINLSRTFNGQTKFKVGLAWEMAGSTVFDLDVSALCLTDKVANGGKCVSIDHLVGYMSNDPARPNFDKITFQTPAGTGFKDPEGSILHMGDCKDGGKDGDDEEILFDLSKVNPAVKSILILVTIYDEANKGLNFGMVKNAMANVYEGDGDISSLSYELQEDYSGTNCLEFIEIYLHNNEWKISARGEANSLGFEDELKKFGIPC